MVIDGRPVRDLAAAQTWTCPACGRSLTLGGAVVALAAPDDGAPAVPVVAHAECLRDARELCPDLAALAKRLEADGRGDTKAAAAALKGALDHATAAVEAAAQALAAAAVGKVKTEAADLVEQARGKAAAANRDRDAARTEAREKLDLAKRTKANHDKARVEAAERTKERDAWRAYAARLEHAAVRLLLIAEESYFDPHPDDFQPLAAAINPQRRKAAEDVIRQEGPTAAL